MSPTWSPDGRRIAFVYEDPQAGGNLDLYAIATDGTGLVRLTDTPGDEFLPAWSPDGSTIAVTRSLNNHADVVLVDVARRPSASWRPVSGRAGCPTRAGCS